MKTIFIVNPAAGRSGRSERFLATLRECLAGRETEGEIYLTQGAGDATAFVREYGETCGAARFIACGGDGTLSEVLNGVIGFPDAEIGVIPMGTGNDFCRNFGKKYDFHNPKGQLAGESLLCDVIRYRTETESDVREGFGINMFNIGFDCNVADMTGVLKKKTFLAGSFAYFTAILMTLIQKRTAELAIELDGEVVHDGKLLLTSVANGCYCGGGIKSNPLASVTDGLLNINIIRNVSRTRFISLLPYYMKGTHLTLSGIEKVITTKECKKMILTPKDGKIRLCVDGEIMDAGRTEFEVIPGGVRFVLPCSAIKQGQEKAAAAV